MFYRLVFLSCLLSITCASWAVPYLPKSDDEILEQLPFKPNDPAMREIRELRSAVAADPENLARAIKLARRYFEQAAAQGDPRFIGYAQATLKPWWDLPQPPPEVLVMRATLIQYRHDFEGALTDLQRAIERQPAEPRAWSLRAVIHVVQADYDESRRDCAKLAPLTEQLIAVACVAFIDGLTGHARQSHDALRAALANTSDATDEQRVWTLTRLAELAWRLNEPKQAEQYFKDALGFGIIDGFLLAAYADFLLDYGRPQEVITLLKDWTRSDPLLLRLTLAEQAVKSKGLSEHRAALLDRYAAARMRGDTTHEQEESRFCLQVLKQPEDALKLAISNWRVQREPRDARVLLEAAAALHRVEAAQPVLDWMSKTNIEDWYLRRLAEQLTGARKS